MTMPATPAPTAATPGWCQDPWRMAPSRYWDGALHDIRELPDRLGVGRAWFGTVMGTIFTALLLFALAQ